MWSDGDRLYFLTNILAWNDRKNRDKIMLRLSFNPFTSKQLYERKAFSGNPECCEIKNSAAFKFLICCDKKTFKWNNLKLKMQEIAKDLQPSAKNF